MLDYLFQKVEQTKAMLLCCIVDVHFEGTTSADDVITLLVTMTSVLC